jgi:hypothetical protein
MLTHILQHQMEWERMQFEYETAEQSRRHAMQTTVTDWLGSNHSRVSHETHCKARQYSRDSGSWILKDQKLIRWKDEKEPACPVSMKFPQNRTRLTIAAVLAERYTWIR